MVIIEAETIHYNLSPVAFHMWAVHFFKANCDFESPNKISPVPYFLCCRAIELELKAKHLTEKRQNQVKAEYGHDLIKSYDSLGKEYKILDQSEYEVLKNANDVYATKGFEYINIKDALTGYSRFPDIDALELVTEKLLQWNPRQSA